MGLMALTFSLPAAFADDFGGNRWDAHYDRRDMARDRADIYRDHAMEERAERNGNWRRAGRLERDMAHDRRDLRNDRRDLHRDWDDRW
jgi:hypothetical protein